MACRPNNSGNSDIAAADGLQTMLVLGPRTTNNGYIRGYDSGMYIIHNTVPIGL